MNELQSQSWGHRTTLSLRPLCWPACSKWELTRNRVAPPLAVVSSRVTIGLTARKSKRKQRSVHVAVVPNRGLKQLISTPIDRLRRESNHWRFSTLQHRPDVAPLRSTLATALQLRAQASARRIQSRSGDLMDCGDVQRVKDKTIFVSHRILVLRLQQLIVRVHRGNQYVWRTGRCKVVLAI